jgi:hypothetical protein
MTPANLSSRGIEQQSGEVLSVETQELLSAIDTRISGPLTKWAVFPDDRIFRLLTDQVVNSDLALAARLEHLSNEEGCGAEIIRGFIGHQDLLAHVAEFRRHVEDEVQHCKSYATLAVQFSAECGLSPPDLHAIDPVEDLGIDYSKRIHLLVLSIHIGELRNLMNMDLMIPALLRSPHGSRQRIGRAMVDIRYDEIGHVRYLSKLVGEFLEAGMLAASDVTQLVDEYDQYWWEDVSRAGANLAKARREEAGLAG